MRENVSTRKCHMGLDARKFSCAKISTFTVFTFGVRYPMLIDVNILYVLLLCPAGGLAAGDLGHQPTVPAGTGHPPLGAWLPLL